MVRVRLDHGLVRLVAKVLVNKLGVFGGQLSRWSVCMAVSCPGGQLTRGQFALVSCRVPRKGAAFILKGLCLILVIYVEPHLNTRT